MMMCKRLLIGYDKNFLRKKLSKKHVFSFGDRVSVKQWFLVGHMKQRSIPIILLSMRWGRNHLFWAEKKNFERCLKDSLNLKIIMFSSLVISVQEKKIWCGH